MATAQRFQPTLPTLAPSNDSEFGPSIVPFAFEGANVRVLTIDGDPWFVARDVALILEYRMASDMTRMLDADELGTQFVRTPSGDQSVTVINESGLYSAIMRSRKSDAKRFRKWVTAEVLPTIRKTGRYDIAEQPRALTPGEMFLQNAQALVNIERAQAEQAAAIAQQGEAMERMREEVTQMAESHSILSVCPPNAEPITKIRDRIGKLYGLPAWVVDFVVWKSPYALKPVMVRNPHADDAGAPPYAAYWIKDVSIVFGRFVRECSRVTPTKVCHPFLDERFNLRAVAA